MKRFGTGWLGIYFLILLLLAVNAGAAESSILPDTRENSDTGERIESPAASRTSKSEKRNQSPSDVNEFGLLTDIGLQLGPNFSSVSSKSNQTGPDASGRARMMFGANIDIGLGAIFFVSPEVDYIQRGFSESSASNGSVTELTAGLSYLEFPVLLKVRPYFAGRIRPFAVFGPSMGFLISRSASVTTTDPNGVMATSTDSTRESQFNSVLFSLNGGVGVDIEMGDTISMAFSLRYCGGLSNWESAAASAVVQRTTSGSSIQLLAGIQFQF